MNKDETKSFRYTCHRLKPTLGDMHRDIRPIKLHKKSLVSEGRGISSEVTNRIPSRLASRDRSCRRMSGAPGAPRPHHPSILSFFASRNLSVDQGSCIYEVRPLIELTWGVPV